MALGCISRLPNQGSHWDGAGFLEELPWIGSRFSFPGSAASAAQTLGEQGYQKSAKRGQGHLTPRPGEGWLACEGAAGTQTPAGLPTSHHGREPAPACSPAGWQSKFRHHLTSALAQATPFLGPQTVTQGWMGGMTLPTCEGCHETGADRSSAREHPSLLPSQVGELR